MKIPLELFVFGTFPLAVLLVVWSTYYLDYLFDKYILKLENKTKPNSASVKKPKTGVQER